MVGVENLLRLQNFNLATRSLGPGQHRQPLDVIARARIVGGHGRHARQTSQFLEGFLLHVVGHARRFNLLFQVFGFASPFVLLAQFFLDGLHLLAQVVLALRLLHAILHFRLNLVAELLDFKFFGEVLIDLFQAHPHIGGLERVLLVGGGE